MRTSAIVGGGERHTRGEGEIASTTAVGEGWETGLGESFPPKVRGVRVWRDATGYVVVKRGVSRGSTLAIENARAPSRGAPRERVSQGATRMNEYQAHSKVYIVGATTGELRTSV